MLIEKKEGSVLILTLNRPPSNSLNLAFFRRIKEALEKSETDANVRCLMLATAIPKYFSSGVDLEDFFSAPGQKENIFLELLSVYQKLALYPKPTIAAISGTAFLGGYILAMACDFRFLDEKTGKIALSEIRLGISPTVVLIRTLAHMATHQRFAKEMILLGKTLRSREALEAGFVDKLIAPELLMRESLQEAQRLAQLPPQAYAAIKKNYREWLAGPLNNETMEKTKAQFRELVNGPEAKEGFLAMQEKRRPKF